MFQTNGSARAYFIAAIVRGKEDFCSMGSKCPTKG